jgi:hypothetical protein
MTTFNPNTEVFVLSFVSEDGEKSVLGVYEFRFKAADAVDAFMAENYPDFDTSDVVFDGFGFEYPDFGPKFAVEETTLFRV